MRILPALFRALELLLVYLYDLTWLRQHLAPVVCHQYSQTPRLPSIQSPSNRSKPPSERLEGRTCVMLDDFCNKFASDSGSCCRCSFDLQAVD